MSTAIHTEIPEQLLRHAQRLVERGWAHSVDALIAESLRRFPESHPEVLTEQFIREEVAWGLRGSEQAEPATVVPEARLPRPPPLTHHPHPPQHPHDRHHPTRQPQRPQPVGVP